MQKILWDNYTRHIIVPAITIIKITPKERGYGSPYRKFITNRNIIQNVWMVNLGDKALQINELKCRNFVDFSHNLAEFGKLVSS